MKEKYTSKQKTVKILEVPIHAPSFHCAHALYRNRKRGKRRRKSVHQKNVDLHWRRLWLRFTGSVDASEKHRHSFRWFASQKSWGKPTKKGLQSALWWSYPLKTSKKNFNGTISESASYTVWKKNMDENRENSCRLEGGSDLTKREKSLLADLHRSYRSILAVQTKKRVQIIRFHLEGKNHLQPTRKRPKQKSGNKVTERRAAKILTPNPFHHFCHWSTEIRPQKGNIKTQSAKRKGKKKENKTWQWAK